MKIALFGATGMIGQRILREALQRGHDVTAIARDQSGVTAQNSTLRTITGDILDPQSVAQVVTGHDVVITAYGPGSGDPQTLVTAARALIIGLKQAGVKKLVIVGGAGTLEVAPGVQLLDTGKLPKEWMPLVLAHRDAFNVYKAEAGDLDYSYFSPAALIEPGERTGKFRLGGDQLLTDEQGNSRISAEDYAVALVDEAENPQHIHQRFTIAY